RLCPAFHSPHATPAARYSPQSPADARTGNLSRSDPLLVPCDSSPPFSGCPEKAHRRFQGISPTPISPSRRGYRLVGHLPPRGRGASDEHLRCTAEAAPRPLYVVCRPLAYRTLLRRSPSVPERPQIDSPLNSSGTRNNWHASRTPVP